MLVLSCICVVLALKHENNLASSMRGSTGSVAEMKKRFLEDLFSEDSKYNSALMTKRKYDSIIEDVKRIKFCRKKESSRDYRLIQRYDVLTVQGREKLIQPLTEDERHKARTYVHADELFDILHSTHLSINHGGRDRMMKELNKLYKNITQAQVRMFLNVCKTCLGKRMNKEAYVKPVGLLHFNSRFHLDFIDYQFQPDDELAMANATSESQAVRNDPSSSSPYSQEVDAIEHPFVKQEVLSDEESHSVDATHHSNVALLSLKSLIAKLRSNDPQQPSTSIKVEPDISEQLPDPTPFSPVITDVRPMKPDPDDPSANQFPSAHSSHKSIDTNEELYSFVASSLVDCQLEYGSSSVAAVNSSSLGSSSVAAVYNSSLRAYAPSSSAGSSLVAATVNSSSLRADASSSSSAEAGSPSVAAVNNSSLRADASSSSSSGSSSVAAAMYNSSLRADALSSSACSSSFAAAVNSSFLHADAPSSFSAGSSSVAAVYNSFLRADAPSSSAGSSSVAAAVNSSSLRADAPSLSSAGSSSNAAKNSSSLRDAAQSSSSSAGDELELCDQCGSHVRKVKGVTVRPKKNVHQPNPYNMRKRKAGSVFCCDSSMCSMGDNRVTEEEEMPVDSRLAKFQAYGQVLAQRLRRLPPRTSSLVQSVIEELLFNAEDGQYDGYLSTKGVLKKRTPVRSLKQIGGFNGYED